MAQDIVIPDIGDADSVHVIELCVAPGDEVSATDAIIVIESDKASMEVPAGIDGVIESLQVALDDEVVTGQVIARIALAEAEPETKPENKVDPEAVVERGSPPDQVGNRVEILLPDVGDAKEIAVVEIAVQVGAEVQANDLLLVVESDKASMELPAEEAGVIEQIHVEEGQQVAEGDLLITLMSASHSAGQSLGSSTGLATDSQDSVDREAAAQTQSVSPARSAPVAPVAPVAVAATVYAGPAVRRLARELGVDLAAVAPSSTGSGGRIVKDDVKAYVKTNLGGGLNAGSSGGAGIPPIPAVDFSKFGAIEFVPMSRIRQMGATNLHRSWLNLPHVTQHDEVDVTELEDFRKDLKEEGVRRGIKVTPLSFIIKACCYLLEKHPVFNSSIAPDGKQYIYKQYYNMGFAVDTPEGLVVPVIANADKKGIWELSEEIISLADKARQQKLSMTDIQGGTFSVSSLGAIGGTGFTPIINAPEVAILGVAKLTIKPVWNGSEFVPKKMLPLSLSYDHRAVNGAEAGRFVAELGQVLSDLRRIVL